VAVDLVACFSDTATRLWAVKFALAQEHLGLELSLTAVLPVAGVFQRLAPAAMGHLREPVFYGRKTARILVEPEVLPGIGDCAQGMAAKN
jgi:hypothetical protein